ncbi:MAG: GNAT family N-acetyltransferase [Rhizobiales bacterium]|nr:GNAT family N-acetyltransferase [Hyphomicrobiales bacterium]
MTVRILRLDEGNAGCLDRLDPDVFDGPIDPVELARFLADPRHLMVVAIADGLVVGMASAFEYFHPDKRPQMFINEVGVSSAFQRKGIGRRLTGALVEIARERGCAYAWLGTEVDNAAAQACFAAVPDGEPPRPFLLYDWELED